MRNFLASIFSAEFLNNQNIISGIIFTFCITLFSQLLALALRFDFFEDQIFTINNLYLPFAFLILITFLIYFAFKLDFRTQQYLSFYEAVDYIRAHTIITILWAFSIYFFRIPDFSRAVIVLQFLICLGLRVAPSILHRIYLENFKSQTSASLKKNALIIGAGEAGHLLIRLLKQHKHLNINPIFVLDDNLRLRGSKVHGVPVVGILADFEEVIKQHQYLNLVLLAIPNISQEKLTLLKSKCQHLPIDFKKIQAFDELVIQDFSSNDSQINEDIILARDTKFLPNQKDLAFYTNKSVLITGGGGSIGSEVVRQILLRKPAKIIIVDTSEYNLFKLDQELKNSSEILNFVLADVRNRERMELIFKEYSPQIVFHAAAYKHVPLAEKNCFEVFDTNVCGTQNVLEISAKNNVDNFVLISSDKAVAPIGIMGATKRLAETIVLGSSFDQPENSDAIKKIVVRFGNVINSTGSVLPTFKEQIISGGPVTVTHPDMERYFMSIQEAVSLVLTATSICKDQGIFVLDMGKKIKISEIAKKMIQMLGKKNIEIVYTGIRAGERLSEDITEPCEELIQTEHSKIMLVSSSKLTNFNYTQEIERFRETLSEEKIHSLIMHLIKNI